MQELKHTPGPWKTEDDFYRQGVGILGADGLYVAHVIRTSAHSETEANARLIAAAPDLLEALQGAVRAMEIATLLPSFKPFIQRGKSAIAKATGQQPAASLIPFHPSIPQSFSIMSRSATIRNLYEKKFISFPFTGLWARAMARPETTGAWLIYGGEKNGKTWFALKLAEYLSKFEKTLYVSAEEGASKAFVAACRRAGICPANRNLLFNEYLSIEELDAKLQKRKAAKVVFLDNLTIYADELRAAPFRELLRKHADKLFVFIAHEEKGAPYTAAGKLARKLAQIIVHVKGLTAHISGRCPGGQITIDEEKAALYWGMPVETDTINHDGAGVPPVPATLN